MDGFRMAADANGVDWPPFAPMSQVFGNHHDLELLYRNLLMLFLRDGFEHPVEFLDNPPASFTTM